MLYQYVIVLPILLVYIYCTDSYALWFVMFGVLQLSEIVNQGQLVSDEIIINLLSKRLVAGEAKGDLGFILDGFPRTIKQAVSRSSTW